MTPPPRYSLVVLSAVLWMVFLGGTLDQKSPQCPSREIWPLLSLQSLASVGELLLLPNVCGKLNIVFQLQKCLALTAVDVLFLAGAAHVSCGTHLQHSQQINRTLFKSCQWAEVYFFWRSTHHLPKKENRLVHIDRNKKLAYFLKKTAYENQNSKKNIYFTHVNWVTTVTNISMWGVSSEPRHSTSGNLN